MKREEKNTQNFLQEMASTSVDGVFSKFDTSINGLREDIADRRLQSYGKNEIDYGEDDPWYMYLLRSLIDPFVLILVAIIIISIFTDVVLVPAVERSYATIILIGSMIVITVIIDFYQEYSSKLTADNLKEMVKTTTAIKRAAVPVREDDLEKVVPGDVIYLAAGDMIPADMRIVEAQDLFLDQASLTGESDTIEKTVDTMENTSGLNVAELDNIALTGTIVVSGSGKGVVVETGDDTYFGMIAESISEDRGDTSFELGVKSVSKLLIQFMVIMVPIVFLINGLTKGDWVGALLFSISIAVGLTPEMLPTIVSSNLAKGAGVLADKKIITKRLSSIQNFGAMDVLCTDKTGTLTIDQIVLESYLNVNQEDDENILKYGYLNSYFQTGLKSLMDEAVIKKGNRTGLKDLQIKYEKIDEIPFDFERRRISVVIKERRGSDDRFLVTKGAIEEMLSISSYIEQDGEILPLDDKLREQVLQDVHEMNLTGMRVLGLARKNNIPDVDVFSEEDERDMILMGYMGFLDPPKETAKVAIDALHDYGVDVKIITGDNEYVTQTIGREVGVVSDQILLGTEVEAMSDEELSAVVHDVNIFAKMSPIQKERVIKTLQDDDQVVGFLGDGINDAPALRQADVGISVDNAVDIAKESADLILLEKDLNVLKDGVVEGRRVFGNIIKYVKMTTSSNFGNVFSVLVASAFLPFLPMLPLQLLVQDLLYGISQIAIPWDNVDEEYLRQPQKWDADSIKDFMIYIGPTSSIFDIVTYALLWWGFGANTLEMAPFFHTGWFIVGLLTQTLVVHFLRTAKKPFIESRSSDSLMLMTIGIIIAGIILPYTGIGARIGFVPMPPVYFVWVFLIIVAYALLVEVMKKVYINKFGRWL